MRALGTIVILCLFPILVSAQGLGGDFFGTQAALTLNPSSPTPNQPFTATLSDYSGGEIRWKFDGVEVPDSANMRTITLVAGDTGSTQNLEASLIGLSGTKTVRTTIRPVYLDVIIEPRTHVPAFFEGRALASPGSDVAVTALINGAMSSEYFYTWRVNRTALTGGPVKGMAQVSFPMPQDSLVMLSLTVTTVSGDIIAQRALQVPSVQPRLVFYEINTLYGMSSRSLGNSFSLISNSTTIQAEPYYLSSAVYNDPSLTEWSIDGSKVSNTAINPYIITLERTGEAGNAAISFRVLSTTELLQHAKNSLQITL